MGRVECVTTGWNDLLNQLSGHRLGDSNVLFLAPSAQKAAAVRQAVADPVSTVRTVTLDELVREVVDSASPGVRRIGHTATEYVVASILQRLSDRLHYLPDVNVFPGVAAAVTRYILDAVNTSPEVLRSGFEGAYGSEARSAQDRDLVLVADEFLSQMRHSNSACRDLLCALALEALQSGECARVEALSNETLILDGVYPTTELRWRLLSLVTQRARHTYILSHAMAEQLIDASSIEEIRSRVHSAELETQLFAVAEKRGIERFDTRDAEIQGVARRIARLLADEPSLSPREIGLVVPNPDRYLSLVAEYFDVYGVPFEAVGGFPLRTSPVACVLLALLRLIPAPGDRAGLFELFSSGLVGAEGVDIHLVDRFARRFNISDLHALEHVFDSLPEDYLRESDDLEHLRASVSNLNAFLDRLKDLGQHSNPRRFIDTLMELLAQLQLVSNGVLALGRPPDAAVREVSPWQLEWSRSNAAALSTTVEVLADVRDALLLFGNGCDVSVADLITIIGDAIRDRRYRCEPTRDAVRVMSLHDARGVSLSHCFVLGLVEGEFPAAPERGFLLRRKGEWHERRREATHSLLDVLRSSRHTYLSTFAADGSRAAGISPILRGCRQTSVPEAAAGQDVCAEAPFDLPASAMAALPLEYNIRDHLLKLRSPDEISRSIAQLKMEIQREIDGNRGPYGGEVSPDRFDLDGWVYSVTQLETYLRCPFQYMVRYLLGIQPLEEVEDELLSNEMGSLIHRILCEFGRNGGFRQMRTDPDAARQILLKTAEYVFGLTAGSRQLTLFMRVQYERLVDGLDDDSHRRGLLRRFFDFEIARLSAPEPADYEHEFTFSIQPGDSPDQGSRQSDSSDGGGSITIAGLIDRIDASEDGSICFITDYKTGRLPSLSRIRRGLSLQLPIYLMALSRERHPHTASGLISAYYHLPPVGRAQIGRAFGDLRVIEPVLGRKPDRYDLDFDGIGGTATLENTIRSICESIRSGWFATTGLQQSDAGCEYCELSRICRHDWSSAVETESDASDGGES
jgi:hypothetical protein